MHRRLDPAWLDAQYNARAAIADPASFFERWARASALAREGSAGRRLDIAYGPGGAAETLDLFPATTGSGPAPVLFFIHGGYWRALDKKDFSFVAPAFNAAGVTVVVPNYALCPAVTVEHITLQMTQALAWTWRNIAQHGGDPSRIVVAGHSAGGHLTAMMLSCRWKQVAEDLPPNLVTGGLAISGLYDLEPLRHTTFLQPDIRLTPASVARLSPAFFPRPRSGPLYAVAGGDESEEFIRQNRLIRDVWGPTAVPVCETVLGEHHLGVVSGIADPAARLHELALRLLGLR